MFLITQNHVTIKRKGTVLMMSSLDIMWLHGFFTRLPGDREEGGDCQRGVDSG